MTPTRRTLLKSVAAAAALLGSRAGYAQEDRMSAPDLILTNGHIATLDRANPEAEAVAIGGGRLLAAGRAGEIMPLAGPPPAARAPPR